MNSTPGLVRKRRQIQRVWDEDAAIEQDSVVVHVAKSYCSTTVLHGCKYLAEPKRTAFERIGWFLILTGFVAVAVYLVWITSEARFANPVIINLDTSYHPIWHYQFPALSFCPLNKINRTLAEKWIEKISLPPYLNKSQALELIPNILRLISPAESEKLELLHSLLELNNITAHQLYSEISIQCKDYLFACKFKNRIVPCRSLFRTTRTSEGYCCSFNYFGSRSEYDMNVYHVQSDDSPTQPVLLKSSGRESGLSVLLRTPKDDNLATLMSSTGTKLIIHKPLNYPDNLAIEKMVQAGRTAYFSITPELINATPDVRTIPMSQRDCYFFDEKELFSLRSYSYKNCIFNCRNQFFVDFCGCIPFIYPAQVNTRICNLLDVPCLVRNKYRLQTLQLDFTANVNATSDAAPCSCRPQCNDISYSISSTNGRMFADVDLLQSEFYDGVVNTMDYSEVTVSFRSLFATRYERIVYYNGFKLLASFGGLLGLFFGFSMVASFEFVYFFTFRILFHIYLSRQKVQQIQERVSRPVSTTLLGIYARFFPTSAVAKIQSNSGESFQEHLW